MAAEPSGVTLEALASSTLLLGAHPLHLYGPSRKELVDRWREVFSMSQLPGSEAIDWGDVRCALWNNVPVKILTDEVFRDALESILIDLRGPADGVSATGILLDRWEGYSE